MEKDRYGASPEKADTVGKMYLLRQELMDETDKKKAKKIFDQIRKIYFNEFGSDLTEKFSEEEKNKYKKEYGDDFFDNDIDEIER